MFNPPTPKPAAPDLPTVTHHTTQDLAVSIAQSPDAQLAFGQLRQAQIELYCDHPTGALVAIRAAVRQLERPEAVLDAPELALLERAAWHVRRHDTDSAMLALDAAIVRLKSDA